MKMSVMTIARITVGVCIGVAIVQISSSTQSQTQLSSIHGRLIKFTLAGLQNTVYLNRSLKTITDFPFEYLHTRSKNNRKTV